MRDSEARNQINQIRSDITMSMNNYKNKFACLENRYESLFNAYASILANSGFTRLNNKIDALMTHLNLEFEDINPGIRVRKKK